MKTVSISRNDLDRLQRPNREVSSFIESRVVSAYDGFTSSFTDSADFDIQGKGETVGEVKHALTRHTKEDGSKGGKGRFRIFKSQHDALTRYDRRENAYYVFVLVDPDDMVLFMSRQKPATVGNIIGSRGGFYTATHNAGPDHKLPWEVFFG